MKCELQLQLRVRRRRRRNPHGEAGRSACWPRKHSDGLGGRPRCTVAASCSCRDDLRIIHAPLRSEPHLAGLPQARRLLRTVPGDACLFVKTWFHVWNMWVEIATRWCFPRCYTIEQPRHRSRRNPLVDTWWVIARNGSSVASNDDQTLCPRHWSLRRRLRLRSDKAASR